MLPFFAHPVWAGAVAEGNYSDSETPGSCSNCPSLSMCTKEIFLSRLVLINRLASIVAKEEISETKFDRKTLSKDISPAHLVRLCDCRTSRTAHRHHGARATVGHLNGKASCVRVPVITDITATAGFGTLGCASCTLPTLGHTARVPRANHRGCVVVAPLPARKAQVRILPGCLEPIRTHGRIALVLDSPSATANLVGNKPSAIFLVEEEEASSVLVDRVS